MNVHFCSLGMKTYRFQVVKSTKASSAEYSAEGLAEYSASRRFKNECRFCSDDWPNADKQENKSGRGGLHLAFCHHTLTRTGKGDILLF